MLLTQQTCPVCGEVANALNVRVASMPALPCAQVTPTGAVRIFPKLNLIVVGAGPGVDAEMPRELTLAEKQAALTKKQQEIDRIEADKRIAENAADIDAKLARVKKGS